MSAYRAHNFSAGPAALPTEVLEQARDELLDYRGTGMSVMEMSHRSAEFIELAERAVMMHDGRRWCRRAHEAAAGCQGRQEQHAPPQAAPRAPPHASEEILGRDRENDKCCVRNTPGVYSKYGLTDDITRGGSSW